MEKETLYDIFTRHPQVTTDTRSLPEGSIFFALRGATFNGNDFAQQALEGGCAWAVVDDARWEGHEHMTVVPDALLALQQLAAEHRHHLGTPIVQITGTNGKTTTKELTTAVLKQKFNVLATEGNFNNHIGVPKTLLRLRPEHEIAVVETGANHPGEIAALSAIVDADCGLITNVGRAHLEGFGSFEGVKRTKGELYDYLRRKPQGFIFLHADDADLAQMAAGMNAVRYGSADTPDCLIEGEVLECNPFLKLRLRERGGEWHTVQTHLIGSYNLPNALAAATVGVHFGVTMEQIVAALSTYEPTNNRSELMQTEHNQLIVDAYNANPTSMKAALDNFSLIPHAHKMMILGEMRELGAVSAEEHRKVAAQAASLGAEVWLVGKEFEPFAADGMHWFADVEAVKDYLLSGHAPSDNLILVKGSNGTRLFQLPEVL